MKKNPVKKTPKGYFYDIKTNKRISKYEVIRREKISEGVKNTGELRLFRGNSRLC